MADAVYIVDAGHRPLGLVPVAALLAAPREAPLRAVMGPMRMWRRSPTISV
jgi:Mg/Co/Ni transporter MgtE